LAKLDRREQRAAEANEIAKASLAEAQRTAAADAVNHISKDAFEENRRANVSVESANRIADEALEEARQRGRSKRRIIVVTDRLPAVAASSQRVWLKVLKSAGMMGVSGAGASIAVEAVLDARQKMREAGEELVAVSWSDADALRFPVGHPRKNVVYIGHPVDPPAYIPVADFHRFLFEHKVAEAQRLIRSLDALTRQPDFVIWRCGDQGGSAVPVAAVGCDIAGLGSCATRLSLAAPAVLGCLTGHAAELWGLRDEHFIKARLWSSMIPDASQSRP
jgi:hypothetical protein